MRFFMSDEGCNRRCRTRSDFSILAVIGFALGSLAPLGAGPAFAQAAQVTGQAGQRDFIEYWAASRLLAYGGNPYSPVELMALQQSAGWNEPAPLIMWNPPWTLLVTLPFGLLDITTGQFLWLLAHVILILLSAKQLWKIYSKTAASTSRLSWVLALTFVPTAFVLIIGQITPLILAGLTLLLYSEQKQNPLAMGAALLILSIKPHLLYLFWIVWILWILEKRPWRVILGAALVGVAAAIIPLFFDAKIYSQYLALYGIGDIPKPLDWPAPTLRNVLRIFFHVDQTWLHLAPTFLAAAWSIDHWRRHKHYWRWIEQLPLVLLVSVASSFFVWTYDQVVVLPAIIEGAIWIRQSSVPWHRFWAARIYIAINFCHLVLRFWLAEELWYFWLAPALLANYLVFRWESSRRLVTQKLRA